MDMKNQETDFKIWYKTLCRMYYMYFHSIIPLYYIEFYNTSYNNLCCSEECVTLYFVFSNKNNWCLLYAVSESGLFWRLVDVCVKASIQNCYVSECTGIKLPGMSHTQLCNVAVGMGYMFQWLLWISGCYSFYVFKYGILLLSGFIFLN